MTKDEILNTRIVIVPDDGAWFVQGIDVDYFASGETRAEAVKNFEEGLNATIKLYQEKHGELDLIRIPSSLAMQKIKIAITDLFD